MSKSSLLTREELQERLLVAEHKIMQLHILCYRLQCGMVHAMAWMGETSASYPFRVERKDGRGFPYDVGYAWPASDFVLPSLSSLINASNDDGNGGHNWGGK